MQSTRIADILRKITAYDVPLIRLKNDTSSYPIYWFKKKGEKWLYYNREQGELDTSIWAENDDEMVYSTVFGSLDYYALQHFVNPTTLILNDPPRHPELVSESLPKDSVIQSRFCSYVCNWRAGMLASEVTTQHNGMPSPTSKSTPG